MPELSTILKADARPLERETLRAAQVALENSKKIAAGLASQTVYLERQIDLAKKAGTAVAVYETELAAVNVQLKAMNAQIATQDSLLAANTIETAANATSKLAGSFSGLAISTKNLPPVLEEIVVIFREIAMGREHGTGR